MLEQYEENLPQGSRGLFEAEQNAGRELGNLNFLNRRIVQSVLKIPFSNEPGGRASGLDPSYVQRFTDSEIQAKIFQNYEGENVEAGEHIYDIFGLEAGLDKILSELGKPFSLSMADAESESLVKNGEYFAFFQNIIDSKLRALDRERLGLTALESDSAVFSDKRSVAELLTENQVERVGISAIKHMFEPERNKESERDFTRKQGREDIKFADYGNAAGGITARLANFSTEKGLAAGLNEKLNVWLGELREGMEHFKPKGGRDVQSFFMGEKGDISGMGNADGNLLWEGRDAESFTKTGSGSLSNDEICRTLTGSAVRDGFDMEKLLNMASPAPSLPSQDLLYEPAKAGGEKAQAAASQGTGGNKMYTIQIEGRGKVEVDGAILKGQMLDTLVENIRPVLIDILDEEMFAESEGSYYF